MMGRQIALVTLWLCGSVMANPSFETTPAVTVSPGGIEAPTVIADTCPTFSWGRATGATHYEVTVFGTGDYAGSEYAEQ